MNLLSFSKGKIYLNGYEFVVLNGSVRDGFFQHELDNLNKQQIPGVASVPHRQITVIDGEFRPSVESAGFVLVGDAVFVCLTNDGRSLKYEFKIFGTVSGVVHASLGEMKEVSESEI